MVELLESFLESCPAVKLVGKRYTNADRDANGSFAGCWGQWWEKGWFPMLEQLEAPEGVSRDYLGAMRNTDRGFEYWIGMFVSPEAEAPKGFEEELLPAGQWGVSYLRGTPDTSSLFGMAAYEAVMADWKARGWAAAPDAWNLERYNCPRYTTPDENGRVILDYCACLGE